MNMTELKLSVFDIFSAYVSNEILFNNQVFMSKIWTDKRVQKTVLWHVINFNRNQTPHNS